MSISQELSNQLKKSNSATVDVNGIKVLVTVSTIRKFCIIKVEREIKTSDPNKLKGILEIINKTQENFKYEIDGVTLKLKTNMWIDTTPTYKSLEELINEMVSNTESVASLLKSKEEEEI